MLESSKFDVFLCHNSKEKAEVEKIREQLKQRGIHAWLDKYDFEPFCPWKEQLYEIIPQIKAVAVFLGRSGVGPWARVEMESFFNEFVKRRIRMGLVILPGCPDNLIDTVPTFINDFHRVDFRQSNPDPMEQLIWGITGKKPSAQISEEAERLQRQHEEARRLPQQLSRKQFLKWVGFGGGGLVTAVLAREIFKEQPEEQSPTQEQPPTQEAPEVETSLQTVEFETVTVDERGEVVERDRNKQAEFFKEDLGNGITLDLVYIPSGKFLMGTEDEEIERLVQKFDREWFRVEKPQHEVTVQPFFMGKYPITQAQWRAIASREDWKIERDLDPNPADFKDRADSDRRPVEEVSWYDAVEFCQRLSKQTGKEYRLPTEAEWEYACRAGTTTPFHFGETITTDLANYNGDYTYASEPQGQYREETTPVGNFPPNAFGLYDMHGNVWEWCEDDWHENYQSAQEYGSAWRSESSNKKVIRGGSWNNIPSYCRSAIRDRYTRDDRDYGIGFRVVCVVPRTTK